MELPEGLRLAIDALAASLPHEKLAEGARRISERYREGMGRGERLVTDGTEAAAYAVVRMPATYGAVYSALKYALESAGLSLRSVLDVGAGTGAAVWAAGELITLNKVACMERETAMSEAGKKLMAGQDTLRSVQWIRADVTSDALPEGYDLVTAAYVLNELDVSARERALGKLYTAAGMMLVIIEPGTPAGYKQMKENREFLLSQGAHIAAPCPHETECKISEDDWCHFKCRVPRTKLHRLLKEGEAPFEDEKFCYIAVTKEPCVLPESRILRHPYIEKGRVTLELCTPDGIRQRKVFKKDGKLYKKARKADAGDSF